MTVHHFLDGCETDAVNKFCEKCDDHLKQIILDYRRDSPLITAQLLIDRFYVSDPADRVYSFLESLISVLDHIAQTSNKVKDEEVKQRLLDISKFMLDNVIATVEVIQLRLSKNKEQQNGK